MPATMLEKELLPEDTNTDILQVQFLHMLVFTPKLLMIRKSHSIKTTLTHSIRALESMMDMIHTDTETMDMVMVTLRLSSGRSKRNCRPWMQQLRPFSHRMRRELQIQRLLLQ